VAARQNERSSSWICAWLYRSGSSDMGRGEMCCVKSGAASGVLESASAHGQAFGPDTHMTDSAPRPFDPQSD
jgi:hypothetical protein